MEHGTSKGVPIILGDNSNNKKRISTILFHFLYAISFSKRFHEKGKRKKQKQRRKKEKHRKKERERKGEKGEKRKRERKKKERSKRKKEVKRKKEKEGGK